VYQALRDTEAYIAEKYDYIEEILPKEISFVTSQELEDAYPALAPREREREAAKKYGAIFVSQIGGKLKSGIKHDGRAPDYDDWKLNGDIIVYYPTLDVGFELSSMGIRVDEDSIRSQLAEAGCEERASLPFQKAIINKELPYTIGGGIGQSRICMFILRKAHIGEVQASVWPTETLEAAEKAQVPLL
jgi:aspartate--ammonia ligase